MRDFILIIGIFFSINLSAQNSFFNDTHFKADFHYGFLLPEYHFFNYLTNDGIKAFDIELTKDLKGKKIWERVYHYPSVGIAGYYGSLGNDTVFGKVTSLYPFIKLPLFERNKILFSSQIGTGIAYSSNKFDIENNYYNIAVASHFNIWFQAKLDFTYRVNDKINFSIGTAFGHFSNANLAEPNLGLNFWTSYAGADYYFSEKTKRIKDIIPEFKEKNEFDLVIAGGGKHTRRFAPNAYFAGSVSGEYRRILGFKFAAGGGADIFYDASIPDEMKLAGINDIKNIYKIKTGFHISQQLIVGKLSLIIQEGFYLGFIDKLNHHKMYNRGIIRYKISKNIFVNLAMKTNLNILDVAEFGIGYYTN